MYIFSRVAYPHYIYKKSVVYLYICSCCQFIDFVSPIQTVDPVTKIRFLIASTATNVDTKSKIIFECSVVDSQHNIHNLKTDDIP